MSIITTLAMREIIPETEKLYFCLTRGVMVPASKCVNEAIHAVIRSRDARTTSPDRFPSVTVTKARLYVILFVIKLSMYVTI
jgi:hypothetical protein